ncbi:hypothetical protein MMC26_002356 [Xylographa opegraphella]|nr:hypothetical protein [Xylographa opegraphella]
MDELEMDTPYIVALASNGGLFAAYKSIVGSVPAWNLFVDDTQKQKVQVWQHKDDEWIHECTSHDAYQMLAKWLPQNFENDTAGFQKCNLTFGPGDSFYVRSPKGCLWNNLPASLEDIILKQMGKGGLGPPETVSLGAGKTWVTTWDGKHYLWMLGSHYYNDVHEELKVNNKDHTGGINYIAISPYEDAYFIHFNNGIFKYHCRVDKRAEKDFNHFIYKFLQERALVDKVSYNLTDKNDRKSIVISPTTSFEEFESFMELSKEPSLQSWMRWLWKKIL